jgi:pimeloyl-ACP methyl ester carboxylesterase
MTKIRAYTLARIVASLVPVDHLHRMPYSGNAREVTIPTADGVALAATLLPRRRKVLIVIGHGIGSSRRARSIVWLAERLAEYFDVLTFDWRGHGASSGHATLGTTEHLDLIAVLNYARELGYHRVGLIGESMGGLISLATLGGLADLDFPRPQRIATLAAPIDYALTVGWRPYAVERVAPLAWARPVSPLLGFRLGVVDPPRPRDILAQIEEPLLVIHGDRDTTVKVENAYLLAEAAPQATLRIYPGADHGVISFRQHCPEVLIKDLHDHFATL